VLVAGGYSWRSGLLPGLPGASVAEDKPRLSLVVLPFENLSGDKEQDYFADGITDDLTTDLSRIPASFVIARNTAFTYKGKPVDAKQIGRELGVRYVLEGSVRRDGESVEVNAQLISTETGAHVWADRFESERSKLGKLQFEIVARLAHSLGIELIRAEALRSERERPNNADAVDLTMRGAALLTAPNASRSAYDDAIKLFERALALDPQNFQATRNLAAALAVRVENNWGPPAVDMSRAEELLNAAAALRPDDSDLHLTKGYAYSLKREWRSALSEAEAAIANDRSNANAYAAAALYKMYLGRSNDGLADIETALRLSPHDWEAPVWQTRLCHLHAFLAQWEQAIKQCEKAVAVSGVGTGAGVDTCAQCQTYVRLGDSGPLVILAAAYAWAGHDKEARETASRLIEINTYHALLSGLLQANAEKQDDPTYRAQMARIIEGLRKAGL
jgi:adenylate cyclase